MTDCRQINFYHAMLRKARLCHSMSPVRPSVCLSVTFYYRDHIRWNTSKRWNRGRDMSAKTCNISETVQDRTKVTMTD